MSSEKNITSGQAVRALRDEKGWSQARLARELKRSALTIQRWEKGAFQPNADACAWLAQIAGPGSEYSTFFAGRAEGAPPQIPRAGDDELRAQVGQLAAAVNRMERRLAALERAASAPAGDSVEGIRVRVPRRA